MGTQRAVAARYIQRSGIIVVMLDSGLELRFKYELVPELRHASQRDLKAIQITPSGQGLQWPALDVDLYVPGILSGDFGVPRSDE